MSRNFLLLLASTFFLNGIFCIPSKILIQIKDKTFTVEAARTPEERKTGLQNRTNLPKNSGMFFLFQTEQNLSFWMKETFIPLSIAFVDRDGIITQIENMEPRNLTPVNSKIKCKYALEMNKGWFTDNHINVGCKIILKEISGL